MSVNVLKGTFLCWWKLFFVFLNSEGGGCFSWWIASLNHSEFWGFFCKGMQGTLLAGRPHHPAPSLLRQVPGLLLRGLRLLHAHRPPASDLQQQPQRRGPQGQGTGPADQLQGTNTALEIGSMLSLFLLSANVEKVACFYPFKILGTISTCTYADRFVHRHKHRVNTWIERFICLFGETDLQQQSYDISTHSHNEREHL